jgi:hypothetical protein
MFYKESRSFKSECYFRFGRVWSAAFIFFILYGLITLTGCASSINVVKTPSSQIDSMNGCPLTTVTYSTPGLHVVTPGKAAGMAFGAIGGGIAGALMYNEGKKIMEQNAIGDPVVDIAAKLKPTISEKFNVSSAIDINEREYNEDSPGSLSTINDKKGLVLDVKTLGWKVNYMRDNFSRYTLIYSVRARLIDMNTGNVIGQVPCTYNSESSAAAAPTYDQLFENGAALFKTKLNGCVDACSELIINHFFESR